MIFGNWRPGGLVAGAGLFGFMDSMQSQVDRTSHALLIVASLVLAVLTVRLLLRRRWITAGISAAMAGLAWFWYEQTDEIPRELIPYFPHFTTLLVLVLASQRLRMPAADGQIFRREGR
jgi:simple sugar transport system permease protein